MYNGMLFSKGIDGNDNQAPHSVGDPTINVASPDQKKASLKRGRRTSPVLDHYDFFTLPEGLIAKCKYYKTQTYKYHSRVSTSNAKRHYVN